MSNPNRTKKKQYQSGKNVCDHLHLQMMISLQSEFFDNNPIPQSPPSARVSAIERMNKASCRSVRKLFAWSIN